MLILSSKLTVYHFYVFVKSVLDGFIFVCLWQHSYSDTYEEKGERIETGFGYTKAADRLKHGPLPAPTHTLDDSYY